MAAPKRREDTAKKRGIWVPPSIWDELDAAIEGLDIPSKGELFCRVGEVILGARGSKKLRAQLLNAIKGE